MGAMIPDPDLSGRLAEAYLTIEEQARELARLRAQQGDRALVERLRALLELTAAAGVVAAPVKDRDELRAIVEAAASVLDAEAAALFLLDEERDLLRFEVALGGRASLLEDATLPVGEGLAGYVAQTGQPLAVSNVEEDARFAASFAQKLDYVPKNLLCVPMVLGDRTVGVLEMLDKRGGAPFGVRDIATLGHFARLAALTVEQMQLVTDLRRLFRRMLADLVGDEHDLAELGQRFADRAAGGMHADTLRLAALVWEISRHGARARHHLIDVLGGLSRLVSTVAPYTPEMS
jgi:transcriptional regulator with GAF, ATPase, and Fis domain